MLFDDMLRSPVLRRALAAGEAQAGRVVGRLLSSEAVATGLQGLLGAASTARATLDAGVQTALKAARVPRADEVQSLQRKVDELEALVGALSARLDEPPRREPPAGEPR